MTIERRAAFCDREAQGYDDEPDHGLRGPRVRQAWSELLADVLPDPRYNVADLGCGTGTLSLLLAELGHRVTGVDFSPEMVARAKSDRMPSVTHVVGDAAVPPIAPASRDVGLDTTMDLCRRVGLQPTLRRLTDAALWGRPITDERYLVVAG